MSDLDGLSYPEALRELEAILAELDRESIDVDRLADRVRRASDLIQFCRSRLATARVDVERIVADLDGIVDTGA
jgi:exodeoxyribonuclease VII small subunit